MVRLYRLAALTVATTILSSCNSPQEPDPVIRIEPIQIDSVEVAILESFPAQARAHITGFIGDGCTELVPIEQTRNDNAITVSIQRQRIVADACTQIAKLFDDVVPLAGTFPPGDYVLHVNDVTVGFRVD